MNLNTKQLSKYFKVLSNLIRFQIFLEILKESKNCNLKDSEIKTKNFVSAIARTLKIPQPSASNHIRELVTANLIYSVKKGKIVYLFGNKSAIHMFIEYGDTIKNLIVV